MPGILSGALDSYLTDLIPPRDEVITEMEGYAKENRVPIVGPLVGRLLYQ